MARDYVRPDLPTNLLAELVPRGVRLLVNPEWDELRKAMQDLQVRCRKHVIKEAQLRALYEQSAQADFVSAIQLTAEYAPAYYEHDLAHSQAAACRLGPQLVGFVLRRCATTCGTAIERPLYPVSPSDEDYDPRQWLSAVLMAFWTRLDDDEIRWLEEDCVHQMFLVRGRERWREDRAWRARQLRLLRRRRLTQRQAEQRLQRAEERTRRAREVYPSDNIARLVRRQRERVQEWETFLHDWMDDMFRAGRPAPVSVLQDGCRTIADTLQAEGRSQITWRELKQRWPSLTTTYHTFFEAEIEGGALGLETLRNIRDDAQFCLSFEMWCGAQRIFDDPQVVFRVDTPDLSRRLADADPEAMKVANRIMFKRRYLWHPAGVWSVGWLRVHKDDMNEILFVDEIQSDALEALRRNDAQIDPEVVTRVEQYLRRWHYFGFASVRSWANQLGYRAAVHSEASAKLKQGMTPSARKWTTYYRPIIKHFGLIEEAVSGYPAPMMVEPRSST